MADDADDLKVVLELVRDKAEGDGELVLDDDNVIPCTYHISATAADADAVRVDVFVPHPARVRALRLLTDKGFEVQGGPAPAGERSLVRFKASDPGAIIREVLKVRPRLVPEKK